MACIAVLGYGTVGSGIVEVIEKNKLEIGKKAGEEVEVKYILDIRDFLDNRYGDRIVHDINIILDDPEVTVVCETMGGVEPAYSYTLDALRRGKSVCTSNKELVALHGPKLLEVARDNQCNYLFEASVGGGIPIIRPINYSLTAEKIESITGILNGTTNYILTKMCQEQASYEDVLKIAQQKGYAEKNPAADVEGHDSCRKIAILSSLMSGKTMNYEHIHTEGIVNITLDDFKYAKSMNMTIKLLAISKEVEGRHMAMVAPFMISNIHPLYMVNGVFNAIFVRGNMLGDSMYYGRGAGKLPTASAVVSDVIDCVRHKNKTITCHWDVEEVELAGIDDVCRRFFVRARLSSERDVEKIFPNSDIVRIEGLEDEVGIFTSLIREGEFQRIISSINGVIGYIRIEE